MLEELRKKAFKKSLLGIAILIIAGAVLIVLTAVNAFYAVTGYVQFETLSPDKIKNQLVDVDLQANFSYFIEEYEYNTETHYRKTTNLYYVILTGDENATDYRYMGVRVPVRMQKQMDAMANNSANGILSDPISFSGKIKKMDKEEYSYFKEYFTGGTEGFTEEEFEEYTLPYYIEYYGSKASMNSVFLIGFFGGLVLVVVGILKIVFGLNGSGLKKFRKDLEAAGMTEASVESDMNSAFSHSNDKKGHIKIGRMCTYYNLDTAQPRAIPNRKIMWAYQNTVTHRTNGVKTGVTYSVMVWAEGYKGAFDMSVPSEAAAQEILKKMSQMFPWAVVGYSDELKKMFNKDRAGFLELRYNKVEHIAVEPGFENSNAQ